ncbi:glycosyltransferase family 2 protein, partial [Rhizobium ruizarguesonis]
VEESSLPSVDIIVPSFNESPRVLSDFLASLANQDYPGVLRVYVVDDCSRNRDAVVSEQIVYADDSRFEFIKKQDKGGPAVHGTGSTATHH